MTREELKKLHVAVVQVASQTRHEMQWGHSKTSVQQHSKKLALHQC